jgi:hypothetical protein
MPSPNKPVAPLRVSGYVVIMGVAAVIAALITPSTDAFDMLLPWLGLTAGLIVAFEAYLYLARRR